MTICRHGRTPPYRCLRCSWGAGKPGSIIERLDDLRLRPVRSKASKHCLLHWLAAEAWDVLTSAWCDETGHSPLLVTSGWRLRRWPTWGNYVADLKRRYVKRLREKIGREPEEQELIDYGRRFLAWESIHFSGLALDIGSHDLEPISATRHEQEGTEAHVWLDDYVRRQEGQVGWVRYVNEPWHLEYSVTRPMWESLPGDFQI